MTMKEILNKWIETLESGTKEENEKINTELEKAWNDFDELF